MKYFSRLGGSMGHIPFLFVTRIAKVRLNGAEPLPLPSFRLTKLFKNLINQTGRGYAPSGYSS
jgi:hypothetical protein